MPDEGLKIVIEADVSQAQAALEGIATSAQKTADNLKKINTSATGGASAALDKFTGQLNKVSPAANAANLALINTGRVFQDLPFGIVGVTNNINPLIESLQRLNATAKQSSQSIGGVLLKSLTGPGGLGFAFSLITSAATFAAVGLSAFTRGFNSTKKEVDETTEKIKSLSDELASLGAANAAQSVSQLQKYKVALNDLQIPLEQRKKALEEYNKEADKSNQIQETDLSNIQKVNTAINSQIELLERRALIRGAEQKLVELYKTIFDSEFKIENAIARTNKQFETQKDLFEAFAPPDPAAIQKFTTDVFNLGKAAQSLGGFDKLKEIEFPLEKAREQVKNILNFIDEQIKKGIDFGGVFKGVKLEIKPDVIFRPASIKFDLPDINLPTLKPKINLEPDFNLEGSAERLREKLNTVLSPEELAKIFKNLTDQFNKADFLGKLKIGVDLGNLEKAQGLVEGTLGGISEEAALAAESINSLLTPAFEDLFSSILKGEPPLKAFFNSIIQSVEKLISKLVEAAIKAAVLTALNIGTGGFGSIFSSLLGFAKGGRPPVGEWVIVGEKGPELWKADRPGRIFSHEQSKSILSSSVKEYHELKDSFIREKVASYIKDYFKSLDVTNQLRESIKSIFVPIKETISKSAKFYGNFHQLQKLSDHARESINNIKESFTYDHSTNFEKLVNSFRDSNVLDRIKETFTDSSFGKIIERISTAASKSDKTNSNIFDRLNESFSATINNIKETFRTTDSENILTSDKVTERFYNSALKDFVSTVTNNISKSVVFKTNDSNEIERFNSAITNNQYITSKLFETFHDSVTRSINNIKEHFQSVSSTITNSIEKLETSFSGKSSVNVERVINNNFFSSEKLSNISKTLSAERIADILGIPKFASGGAVFAPTLALLGEGFGISRSNPEFVGTARQLQGIVGGSFDFNHSFDGQFKIDGNDLLLLLNRAMRSNQRTSGKNGLAGN